MLVKGNAHLGRTAMHKRMAVLTETLEVVIREGHVRVVDVLRGQVNLVVNDLRRSQLATLKATLAHTSRYKAIGSVNDALHVSLAVLEPSW